MHCFGIRFMCKVVMLSLFVVGLNPMARGSTELSREAICSKAKRELDKCDEQGDACDKAQALKNADEFAKKAQGSLKAELLHMKNCHFELMMNCLAFKHMKISFIGKCHRMNFEANRHCVMSACPGWTLVSYLEGNCAISECYSSASLVTKPITSV